MNERSYYAGQIAAMLSISRSTVVKWIDTGALRCYYLPNLSRSRRKVWHSDLVAFCKVHGLHEFIRTPKPMPRDLTTRSALLCGVDPAVVRQLLPFAELFKVSMHQVGDPDDLIKLVAQPKVLSVAIDLAIGVVRATALAAELTSARPTLVAVAIAYPEMFIEKNEPFTHTIKYPFHPRELATLLCPRRKYERRTNLGGPPLEIVSPVEGHSSVLGQHGPPTVTLTNDGWEEEAERVISVRKNP